MNVASFDVKTTGELAGKVAVVTGGAAGIGRATVEKFVAEGARVVIADIDDDAGRALADELGEGAAFRRTDAGDRRSLQEAVDFAVERFGGLHVMFNNAGVSGPMARFLHDDLEDCMRVMQVNVLGVMLGCQFAARHMKDHGGGSIINCASTAGIQAGSGLLPYRASKAAVIHATKSIAVDVAQYGIRVNCIAPGQIQTGMTSYDMDSVIRYTQPLPRHGSAADVAETVAFLAGDRSAQVTGVLIPIDGGTTAGPPPSLAKMMLQGGGSRPA